VRLKAGATRRNPEEPVSKTGGEQGPAPDTLLGMPVFIGRCHQPLGTFPDTSVRNATTEDSTLASDERKQGERQGERVEERGLRAGTSNGVVPDTARGMATIRPTLLGAFGSGGRRLYVKDRDLRDGWSEQLLFFSGKQGYRGNRRRSGNRRSSTLITGVRFPGPRRHLFSQGKTDPVIMWRLTNRESRVGAPLLYLACRGRGEEVAFPSLFWTPQPNSDPHSPREWRR